MLKNSVGNRATPDPFFNKINFSMDNSIFDERIEEEFFHPTV
jgi:hypothetical protein